MTSVENEKEILLIHLMDWWYGEELVKRALKNGSQVFNLHNWLAVGDIKKHWEKPRFINRIDNYSDEISSEQLKHVIL